MTSLIRSVPCGLPKVAQNATTLYGGLAVPFTTGNWSTYGDSITTVVHGADNDMRLHPAVVLGDFTVDRVAVEVTVAGAPAGSVLRLGVYTDQEGQPGLLIKEFGTVAADAVAVPELAVSPSLILPAGVYWMASVAQLSGTTRPTVRVVNRNYSLVSATASLSLASGSAYLKTAVSGALPGSATDATRINTAVDQGCRFAFRKG